jgi:hypothetical protein
MTHANGLKGHKIIIIGLLQYFAILFICCNTMCEQPWDCSIPRWAIGPLIITLLPLERQLVPELWTTQKN